MAKNLDLGDYSVEISRHGNQAESTFSWTVYTAGRTVASGRAEGPHEAEQYARAVVDGLMGIEPVKPVAVFDVIIPIRIVPEHEHWALPPPRTRWQRLTAWFKEKIEHARLRLRYSLW